MVLVWAEACRWNCHIHTSHDLAATDSPVAGGGGRVAVLSGK